MVAKVKAAGDRPTYDVITLAGVGAAGLGDAGLLVKPDLDKLPNLKDVSRAVSNGRKRLWCRLPALVRRPDLQHVDRQDASLVVRSAVGPQVRRPPVPAAARVCRGGRSGDHRREDVGRLAAEHRSRLQEARATEGSRHDARRESEPGRRPVPHGFARYRRHLFAGVLSRPDQEARIQDGRDLRHEGRFCHATDVHRDSEVAPGRQRPHSRLHQPFARCGRARPDGCRRAERSGQLEGDDSAPKSRAYVPSPQQIAEKAFLHDDKALAVVQPAWIKRYTEIFSA